MKATKPKIHWWEMPCHCTTRLPELTNLVGAVTCLTCLDLMLNDHQFSGREHADTEKRLRSLRSR